MQISTLLPSWIPFISVFLPSVEFARLCSQEQDSNKYSINEYNECYENEWLNAFGKYWIK